MSKTKIPTKKIGGLEIGLTKPDRRPRLSKTMADIAAQVVAKLRDRKKSK